MTRDVLISIKRKEKVWKNEEIVRTTLPTYNIESKLTWQSSGKIGEKSFQKDSNKY